MKELVIDGTNIPNAYQNFYSNFFKNEFADGKYVLVRDILKTKYNATMENNSFFTTIVFHDTNDYVRFMLEWS